MTRAARTSRQLAELFGTDPHAAVVQVVREAGTPVNASKIKDALRNGGVADLDERAWRRLQVRLRVHENVVMDGRRYRWVSRPMDPSPIDAFAELVRVAGDRARPSHVKIVERALVDTPSQAETAARHRQAVIDGARSLAELASEVEELVTNGASARATIHRVRSRAKLSSLEPISRAGDRVPFDTHLHAPVGQAIAVGASVLVLRPGYVWRTQHEELVIIKAAVQE